MSGLIPSGPLTPAVIVGLLDEVMTLERDILVVKYFNAASVCLLVYDTLLNIDKEVKYIWHSRLSFATFLYFFMRYGNLLVMGASLYWMQADGPFLFCKLFFYIDAWFSVLCAIPVPIVLTFRTYALYGCTQTAKWLLGILLTITIGAFVVSPILITTGSTFSSLAITPACIFSETGIPQSASYFLYGAMTLFDICILSSTLWKVHTSYRAGDMRLVKLIVRDSVWYFLALNCETIVTIILWTCLPERHIALRQMNVNMWRVICIIIVSHVILNLRDISADKDVTITTLTASPFGSRRFPRTVDDELEFGPGPAGGETGLSDVECGEYDTLRVELQQTVLQEDDARGRGFEAY